MFSFIGRAVFVGLVIAGSAWATQPIPRHLRVALVAETSSPTPGSTITLAVSMTPEKGWHGYWKVPGDAGFPTTLTWHLPRDATAGEPAYPVPTTLVIAGMMNHVFEGQYALLVPLKLSPGLSAGTSFPVSLRAQYLVCTSALCVPESADADLTLTIGDGVIDGARSKQFGAWRQALPRPIGTETHYQRTAKEMRFAFLLPHGVTLKDPHLFVDTEGAVTHNSPQIFAREGDVLTLSTSAGDEEVGSVEGILALGNGTGLSFSATAGVVPPVKSSLLRPSPE